jgi:hypothetical protein
MTNNNAHATSASAKCRARIVTKRPASCADGECDFVKIVFIVSYDPLQKSRIVTRGRAVGAWPPRWGR